ncbi:MAG: N-6 DNA methylase, partial [Candidatus Omnitrophica bacterium]|nr:N-6 DNA methylase [Candidatus Omnitrophota bacterium]
METQLAKKKLRGAFYTPKIIADFLCKWAIKSPSDSLLEPCFGDGEFLFSTIEVMQSLGASKFQIAQCITGIELDLKENAKVKNLLRESAFEMPSGAILQGDFFSHYHRSLKNNRYDVVIGNPPFLRYQNFPEDQREKAFRIIEEAGLKPNRLTNAWVPFVLAASLLLKEEGRLAMVVPAELLQVNYASQLRHFLNEYFSELTVITFKKIVFPDIQQEVVLLLAKKGQKRHGINVVELKNGECLVDYEHELPQINELKPINHSSDKWTQYYLTTKEILLLRNLQHRLADQTLGAIAEVDVGIVTGRNEFFVTDSAVRKTYNLATYSLPLVGRTSQIRGLIFTKEDWLLCEKGGQKTYLLNFPQLPISKLPKLAQKYIQIGEKVGYHEGYKCRIRNPWYCVPSQWVSDALLFRQIYDAPRLVLNNAESYTTDTIHRVR